MNKPENCSTLTTRKETKIVDLGIVEIKSQILDLALTKLINLVK